MRGYPLTTASLIFAVFVVVSHCPNGRSEDAKRPSAPKPKIESHEYEGRLMSMDNVAISLLPYYHHAINSRNGEQTVQAGTPVMRFPIAPYLAARKPLDRLEMVASHPHALHADWMYALTDAKACDTVRLFLDDSSGRMEVRFFKITRRPGGKIPVAPGEQGERFAYHLMMQEVQDFEEHGTQMKFIDGLPRKDFEARLVMRKKHIEKVLGTAEKIEKEKKAKELKADPKAEKK